MRSAFVDEPADAATILGSAAERGVVAFTECLLLTIYYLYFLLGLVVLVLTLFSGPLKAQLWLSGPLIAMGVGVLVGPYGLDLFAELGLEREHLEYFARLTLAISLVGVALRLPSRFIAECRRSLAILLLVGMPAMWLIVSALAFATLGLPLLLCLLLGAVAAPTDPVIASGIVTGELAESEVEEDIRNLISAESGFNDGLAYLLVMVPVLLLDRDPGTAESGWVLEWIGKVLVLEVCGSFLGGLLIGILFAHIFRWSRRHRHHDHTSVLAIATALAMSVLGAARLIHGDGILAIFAAGLGLKWRLGRDIDMRYERVQEVIRNFFDVPVFVLFGILLPWTAWSQLGAPVFMFVIAVLLLRRLPVVWVLRRRLHPLHGKRDVLFVGWFGPIGVAAMDYLTWAESREHLDSLWPYGSLIIFASILLHGVSASPLTRWYGRSSAGTQERSLFESGSGSGKKAEARADKR